MKPGEPWWERVHPDDLPAVREAVQRHVDGRTRMYRHEHRVLGPDGQYYWRYARGMVVERNDRGEAVRMVGIHTDITRLKLAEEALAASEAKYRTLFQEARDGIFLADRTGRFTDCNPAGHRMLGYDTRAELVGLRIEDVFDPVDLAQLPVQYDRLDSGPALSHRRLIRKDGSVFEAEILGARLPDESMLGVARDVTERLRLERAERDREVAEQASKAKTEFMARVSHELRTPLNAVIGFSDLLLHDSARAELSAHAREKVEHIHRAGEHLLLLINDIMELSSIEAGALKLRLGPVDLALAAQAAAQELMLTAQEHQVALNLEGLAAHPVVVHADAVRLRQVMLNLLSNAIKYNRVGGVVVVRATVDGRRVRVSVSDTGLGMTPAQQRQLFQPFNRLGREDGAEQGTGIGLVITRQLLNLMDGSLEVHSEPGVGSTFSFDLPAGTAGDPSPRPTAGRATVSAGRDAQGRVLYVEDDPVNQALVQAQLSLRPGIALQLAGDGQSALAMARARAPDLFLIDIHLPDMHGVDLLKALREDPVLARVPCVALSANALPEDIRHALNAGFSRYLTKPATTDRLLAMVDDLLSPGQSGGTADTRA